LLAQWPWLLLTYFVHRSPSQTLESLLDKVEELSEVDRDIPARLSALLSHGPSKSRDEAVGRLATMQRRVTLASEEEPLQSQIATGLELVQKVRCNID